MMRRSGIALLCGLATMWLVGCNKPCATTSDCGSGDVCTAAICRALSCEEAMFARDPKSGACVALSGCFLTAEQRTWQTCQEDPCTTLAESSCLSDARCQATYATPDVTQSQSSGNNTTVPVAPDSFCGGGSTGGFNPVPPLDPEGVATAAGVNNGDQPKHGSFSSGCLPGTSRKYAGCRAVPQITPQKSCTFLNTDECKTRTDCTTKPGDGTTGSGGATSPRFDPGTNAVDLSLGQCFDLYPRQTTCEFADARSCLTNPDCQAIGASCYCPPGGSCDCSGGGYLGCEKNDRLRRCSSSAECGADERCDNDEACIMPRTFTTTPVQPSGPGAAGCIGACVPKGCAGMGEQQCNANSACDSGSYGTVCRPKPYCVGGGFPKDDGGGINDANVAGGGNCGCDSEFTGCAPQTPVMNVRAERSLLVRDAEIIDDPKFSLLSVLTQLAPAGQVDAFAQSMLSQVGAAKQVASGAITKERQGFTKFYPTLKGPTNLAQTFAAKMATTALINRLDLASANNCGEARLSFAMTSAYQNGNQRMTMIVELKVPDDGNGCKTVAQSWAELSLLDDVAVRKSRLIALYSELLKPANVGQIRTNEFVNFTGGEAWELREFHINSASGLLDMVPVAQTVDPSKIGSPALLTWLGSNAASLKAGTAIIPPQFLAASSTEDGARLSLAKATTDPTVLGTEKQVNALACAGCHLTETKSPFVHIGERLAQKVGGTYRPVGRAVIDEFMQKELVSRAALLNQVLTGTHGLLAMEWRPLVQARVH